MSQFLNSIGVLCLLRVCTRGSNSQPSGDKRPTKGRAMLIPPSAVGWRPDSPDSITISSQESLVTRLDARGKACLVCRFLAL